MAFGSVINKTYTKFYIKQLDPNNGAPDYK